MENTFSNKSPEIELDISPLSLEVYVGGVQGLTSGTDIKYQGTGILEIGPKGMCINPRKSGKLLIMSIKSPYEVKWSDVREIKNQLLHRNKRFRVNFGKDKSGNDILVWITLQGEAKKKAGELSAILDKLSPAVSMKRCPVCSGIVENGICKSCGRNFKALQRRKGLGWLTGGVALFVTGLILTTGSEKTISSGSSITVYIGLLLFGIVIAIFGVIKIISGKR